MAAGGGVGERDRERRTAQPVVEADGGDWIRVDVHDEALLGRAAGQGRLGGEGHREGAGRVVGVGGGEAAADVAVAEVPVRVARVVGHAGEREFRPFAPVGVGDAQRDVRHGVDGDGDLKRVKAAPVGDELRDGVGARLRIGGGRNRGGGEVPVVKGITDGGGGAAEVLHGQIEGRTAVGGAQGEEGLDLVGQDEYVPGGGVRSTLIGPDQCHGEDLLHGVDRVPVVRRVESIEPGAVAEVPLHVVGQAGGGVDEVHVKRRAHGVLLEGEDHDRRGVDDDGVVHGVVAAEVAGEQADAVVDHAVALGKVELGRRFLREVIAVDGPQIGSVGRVGEVGEFDIERGAAGVRGQQEVGRRRVGDVDVLGGRVLTTERVAGDQGDGVGAVVGEGEAGGLHRRAADPAEVPVVGGLTGARVGDGQVEVGAAEGIGTEGGHRDGVDGDGVHEGVAASGRWVLVGVGRGVIVRGDAAGEGAVRGIGDAGAEPGAAGGRGVGEGHDAEVGAEGVGRGDVEDGQGIDRDGDLVLGVARADAVFDEVGVGAGYHGAGLDEAGRVVDQAGLGRRGGAAPGCIGGRETNEL